MIATLLALTQLLATGDSSQALRDSPRNNSSKSEKAPVNIQATEDRLTAHLEAADAIALGGDSVEVNFILTNCGPRSVHLAERWNSWGAQQWWFTIKDANNQTCELHNPQSMWYGNYLSLFEIKPNESYEFRCRLMLAAGHMFGAGSVEPDGSAAFCAVFPVSPLSAVPYAEKVHKWSFPLTITGHFNATITSLPIISSDWEGAIETRPLVVRSVQSSKPIAAASRRTGRK
jgi:hypothetical protein